jgi:hypothetical protein
MLLLVTPRQPGPKASIVHTLTINHFVVHDGNAPINRCEQSNMPPPSKAQNSNTYHNKLISPPSWAGSRGVQHIIQFLSRREWAFPGLYSPSLYNFFRYVKSLSSWKPSLVSWWHVLKSITQFVFGFVIYSNMWHLLLFILFPWRSVTSVFKRYIIPSMHLLYIAFLQLENPLQDIQQG